MDKKETMLEMLDAISNIIIKKEIETEENEEIKQLFNEALALENKVKSFAENSEFTKDRENISKLMTVSLICSRIENSTRKVVKDDLFKSFADKLAGGDKDGE